MTLANQIQKKIEKLPMGKPFGYKDLGIDRESYLSAAKAIERLQKKGTIKKISKGNFYKPEQTVFGELKPDYVEQMSLYLFENGKRIAYETGVSLYNRMGLTTQMAFRIKIASRSKRISINRGALRADAVKSYVDVTESNYELLGFLDAIKDIKRIPDCPVSRAIVVLATIMKEFDSKRINELIRFAMSYPPRVRALVGALLESLDIEADTTILRESLNPLTTLKIGVKEKDLGTIKNWNIE